MTITRARSRNNARYAEKETSIESTPVDNIRITRQTALGLALGNDHGRDAQPVQPMRSRRCTPVESTTQHDSPLAGEIQTPKRMRRFDSSSMWKLPLLPALPTRKRRRKRQRRQRNIHHSMRKRRVGKIAHRTPPLRRKTIKFLLSVDIARLPRYCTWSQEKCLKWLNWTIRLRFSEDCLFPEETVPKAQGPILPHDGMQNLLGTPRLLESNRSSSKKLALKSIDADLETERYRMRDRLSNASLQLPMTWTPIQDVSPPTLLGVREGTVDSVTSDEPVAAIGMAPPQQPRTSVPGRMRLRSHIFRAPMASLPITSVNARVRSQVATVPSATSLNIRLTPSDVTAGTESTQNRRPPSVQASKESRYDTDSTQSILAPVSHSSSVTYVPSIRTRGSNSSMDDSSTRSFRRMLAFSTQATKHSSPVPMISSTAAETTITCNARLQDRISLIHEWEMAVVMDLHSIHWAYQQPEVMQSRAQLRNVRPFLSIGPSPNPDIGFSAAAARFLSIRGENARNSEETHFSVELGRLFADIMSTPLIPSYRSLWKQTLPGLQSATGPVTLDVACLPSREALPWDPRAIPLLLAAQFSANELRQRQAAEQLACAFHPTIILLILYYLDTRSQTDDSLPPWMVVYGIIYTRSGFAIQEHYPIYQASGVGSTARWGAVSSWIETFQYFFDCKSPDRSRSLSTLLRICGHAQLILEKLRGWDGYNRIVQDNFIIRDRLTGKV